MITITQIKMKNIISKKTAGICLIISLIFLMIFHLLVILQILPSNIVWGGQIEDSSSVIYFEIIAAIITAFFILIAIAKTGYIKKYLLIKITNVCIWLMVIFFSLSIIMNLSAKSNLEKLIFTPLSLIMALCSVRLIINK